MELKLWQYQGEYFHHYLARVKDLVDDRASRGIQDDLKEQVLCVQDGMLLEIREFAKSLKEEGFYGMDWSELWDLFLCVGDMAKVEEDYKLTSIPLPFKPMVGEIHEGSQDASSNGSIKDGEGSPMPLDMESHECTREEPCILAPTPPIEIIPNAPIEEPSPEPISVAFEKGNDISHTFVHFGEYVDPWEHYFNKPPAELCWWY